MRELTKSVLRVSWAMPLFGIRQFTALSLPTEANLDSATRAFDAVSDAAQEELGVFRAIFDVGDRLQSSLVDATLGVVPLDALNPLRWVPGGGRNAAPPTYSPPRTAPPPAAPTAAPAAPTAAPAAPTAPAPRTAAAQELGWGPMPS